MSDAVRDPDDASRPAAARLIDAARAAEAAARARLAGAVADLFVPDAGRLSDYQRATVTRLLDGLLRAIEAPLRERVAHALPAGAARAALETARLAIARPRLDAAGVLREPALVALLLRRAEEHRLRTLLRLAAAREGRPEALAVLAADRDMAVAQAAAGLAAAEAARIDRFRDPAIAGADLPAEIGERLIWSIAAAVRAYLIDLHGIAAADADAAIVPAATALLRRHDESAGVDARAMALARALARAGRLDDAGVVTLVAAGELAAFTAALASRARIEPGIAWDMVLAPDGERLALLLRAADIARSPAGEILLRLAPDAAARVGAQIAAWDMIAPAAALEALRLWRLDAGYRAAILALHAAPAP